MPPRSTTRTALATGGLAALLACACCLEPLLLVSIGLGGVGLRRLSALERWSPALLGGAAASLWLAYRRIDRPVGACAPGEVCASPAVRPAWMLMFWLVVTLVVLALAFPWLAPQFL